jgi:hypothetical protein
MSEFRSKWLDLLAKTSQQATDRTDKSPSGGSVSSPLARSGADFTGAAGAEAEEIPLETRSNPTDRTDESPGACACTCDPLPSQREIRARAQAGCGPGYRCCETCGKTWQCKVCLGCRYCRTPG